MLPPLRRATLAAALLALVTQAWAMPPLAAGPEDAKRIEAVLPAAAPAKPLKPRRLLIFDLNVVYGGHGSIPFANTAFTLIGQKTGAFETVVSRDPAVFQWDSLKTFDAVFFNNTVGNQFADPVLRQNLLNFVLGGGGLMGCHGTTVGFIRWDDRGADDWPEWGAMIGGRGASHTTQDERCLIRVEDPASPLTACFPGNFEHADEFFRFGGTYSRLRDRVLLSIDNEASAKLQGVDRIKRFRDDEDYPVAWIRNYGQGRVFYCSLAHSPKDFLNPDLLKFYLAGAQFALGDLPAPTIPSGKLTPALRAQEQLGWRLGVEAYTFHKYTLFEMIDKVQQLGLPYCGGLNFQKVSREINKNLDPNLTPDELRQVRQKLDAAGLRMLTYFYQNIPGDEAGCRKLFEFGRQLGIETFIAEPKPDALPVIDRFCNEYKIKVALHNHAQQASPNYWCADAVLQTVKGLSPMIGAAPDVGYWLRGGLDPITEIRKLGQRLITLQMHDLDVLTAEGHDVPWGTGAGRSKELLLTMHRLGIKPVMIGLEYSYDWLDSMPEIAQTIGFVNELSLDLAEGKLP